MRLEHFFAENFGLEILGLEGLALFKFGLDSEELESSQKFYKIAYFHQFLYES